MKLVLWLVHAALVYAACSALVEGEAAIAALFGVFSLELFRLIHSSVSA